MFTSTVTVTRTRTTPKYHIIPIEVPAHVAAYYDSQSNGRIKVGRTDFIGNIVLCVLEPMPFGAKPLQKRQDRSYVDLVINQRYADRRRHIPGRYLPEIKSLIRGRFKESFEREVDKMVLINGMQQSDAIRLFREKNGITEDIFPFESSYRAYTRHKNGK